MTASPCVLHDFRSLAPGYREDQASAVDWIAAAHAQSEVLRHPALSDSEKDALARKTQKLVTRFGRSTDRIRFRNSALEDYTHQDWERMRIFTLHRSSNGQPARDRSLFYSDFVNRAFQRFYIEDQQPPPAMIHVTCTGYVSPSGAQRLVSERGWGESTEVLHAYHMGCYAALPAIRIARGLLATGKSSVDLVHTELCTLHLNPAEHSAEQLVVQTLFSDGLIRYSASVELPSECPSGLRIVAAREEVLSGTEAEMTWMASGHGMEMTLSREIPDRIGGVLEAFLKRLSADAGTDPNALIESGVFAIHPGGPGIIDQVQNQLKLRDDQVAFSNSVLENHGNMSSATLPHIWQKIVEDPMTKPGTRVVSMAFGPGLTISGVIFEKMERPRK